MFFNLSSVKVLAIAIPTIIVVGFASGWMVNGWRYQAKIEVAKANAVEEYENLRKSYMQKFQKQEKADEAARKALSDELSAVRRYAATLGNELDHARLVSDAVQVEGCTPDGSVIANPFSDDFVRLWNNSASGPGPDD